MRVAVPRETAAGERRVALVPETVSKLTASGFEVVVARGAGVAAGYDDDAYVGAGATLAAATTSHPERRSSCGSDAQRPTRWPASSPERC